MFEVALHLNNKRSNEIFAQKKISRAINAISNFSTFLKAYFANYRQICSDEETVFF